MNGKYYHRKDIIERYHVSRRIIENYEDLDLIRPMAKDKMGHLLYDEKTVMQIGKIRFLQILDMELSTIKKLIDDCDPLREEDIIKRQICLLENRHNYMDKLIRAAALYLKDKEGFLDKEEIKELFKDRR